MNVHYCYMTFPVAAVAVAVAVAGAAVVEVAGFQMTENVSQMLSQSETQTEDQHYWQWIPTGILTPSESKCD